MIQKILLFLLVLLSGGYIQSSALAVDETVAEYNLEWYLSFGYEKVMEDKLDLETAKTICTRMFDYADYKQKQLSFGEYPVNRSWCSKSARTAIAVALDIAEQLSLTPRKYSCEDETRINFMDDMAFSQLSHHLIYGDKREGAAQILCSETGSYCIANQNVLRNNNNHVVFVTCVPMSGLVIEKNEDGSCTFKGGTVQNKQGFFLPNAVSLDYFDENCRVKSQN